MGVVSSHFRQLPSGNLQWYCPGCRELHTLNLGTHQFDGIWETPTFSPIFDHTSTIVSGEVLFQRVCAYYIVGGTVQYVDGCDHLYRGRIIPLPYLPAEFRDH